ncbi:MAG TPA: septum formation initiator family protein [Acidimicrobiia bacterium]|nr:septum formation initiator family protein [Acidimicrobiia bacterium]
MRLLRRPVVFLISVAVLVVAVAVTTNALPLRQIVDQQQEVAEARATLDQLNRENAILTDQVTALQTPVEIERLAREKLGYVRPGEAAYVVIEEEAPPATFPSEHPVDVNEGEALPFISRVLDFITGRDLVDG